MKPAMTSRALQAQQTRALLVRTAERLFAERGYDATSLQAIADEVGLTKAAVYYHFPTKSALLHAGAEPSFAALHKLLEQAATKRSQSARIAFVVDGLLDILIADRTMLTIINQDPAARRDKVSNDASGEIVQCALEVFFGSDPTPAERAAFAFATRLPEVLADLAEVDDEQLRAVLRPLCIRILTVRR
jgi:AcrR family transcriptional regulator